MELVPTEYPLIRYLQKMSKAFKSSGTVTETMLKKFCEILLSNSVNHSRFAAMYESCYNSKNSEQKEFYDLSRKIDYIMVDKMGHVGIYKDYDNMMNHVLDGEGHSGPEQHPTHIRYNQIKKSYDDNSFRFRSILIPRKKKMKQEAVKFDPKNLM